MIRTIKLEEHEKDAVATVLDMFREMETKGYINEVTDGDTQAYVKCVTLLADIFHRYA
jgi:hypothetical protein